MNASEKTEQKRTRCHLVNTEQPKQCEGAKIKIEVEKNVQTLFCFCFFLNHDRGAAPKTKQKIVCHIIVTWSQHLTERGKNEVEYEKKRHYGHRQMIHRMVGNLRNNQQKKLNDEIVFHMYAHLII